MWILEFLCGRNLYELLIGFVWKLKLFNKFFVFNLEFIFFGEWFRRIYLRLWEVSFFKLGIGVVILYIIFIETVRKGCVY